MEINESSTNVSVNEAMFASGCPAAIALERERFDVEVSELQDVNSSSGRLLYVFVRRNLRSFGLDKTMPV
jgi:hypothetical protein